MKKTITGLGLLLMLYATPTQAQQQIVSGQWVYNGDAQSRLWDEDSDCTFEGCHQGWIEHFNRRTGNWSYCWFQVNENDPGYLHLSSCVGNQGDWVNSRENQLMTAYGYNPNAEPPYWRDPRMHRGKWCHDHGAMNDMLREATLNSARGSWMGGWWLDVLTGNWRMAAFGWLIQASTGFISEGASQHWDCGFKEER